MDKPETEEKNGFLYNLLFLLIVLFFVGAGGYVIAFGATLGHHDALSHQ